MRLGMRSAWCEADAPRLHNCEPQRLAVATVAHHVHVGLQQYEQGVGHGVPAAQL